MGKYIHVDRTGISFNFSLMWYRLVILLGRWASKIRKKPEDPGILRHD